MRDLDSGFPNARSGNRVTRRTLLGATAALGGRGVLSPTAVRATPPRESAGVGDRPPWLLIAADALRPAAPGPIGAAELAEVHALQRRLTGEDLATIARWDDPTIVLPWTTLALDLIKAHQPNPVRAGRGLALLHAALFTALTTTRDASAAFPRPAPALLDRDVLPLGRAAPSPNAFPSGHAAVAAAAAVVLGYLFPREPFARLSALAVEAASSRLMAGHAVRSDIEAGQAIGAIVGQRAVARGMGDGADVDVRPHQVAPPVGAHLWQPTPPAFVPEPVEPLAGTWRTWVLPSGNAYRPPPPPAYGSLAWQAEFQTVQMAVAQRTPDQEAAVLVWAGGPSSVTPAGLWIEIARDLILRDRLEALPAAGALALTSVAMADAFLCCWDAKYAYWTARPITADPALAVLIPTPPFPSYTSGHSTISTAAATVLGHVFPADAAQLASKAVEAKNSRLWAGIHFPIDNDMGALGGGMVGRVVVTLSA